METSPTQVYVFYVWPDEHVSALGDLRFDGKEWIMDDYTAMRLEHKFLIAWKFNGVSYADEKAEIKKEALAQLVKKEA